MRSDPLRYTLVEVPSSDSYRSRPFASQLLLKIGLPVGQGRQKMGRVPFPSGKAELHCSQLLATLRPVAAYVAPGLHMVRKKHLSSVYGEDHAFHFKNSNPLDPSTTLCPDPDPG